MESKIASDILIPQLLQNDADIRFSVLQNRHFCETRIFHTNYKRRHLSGLRHYKMDKEFDYSLRYPLIDNDVGICFCSCIYAKRLTVCVSGLWSAVDFVWKRKKLEARKRLENRA